VPTNRQITLAARPVGFPSETDFVLVESRVPDPDAGEVLVRTRWLSLDPYMRGRMSEARSYARPTEIGEVMTAQVVGEVVASDDPRYVPGDEVVGQLGWQEYAVARGGALRKIDTSRRSSFVDSDEEHASRSAGRSRNTTWWSQSSPRAASAS